MLKAPQKGAVACSLLLAHLHSPLPMQMLNENIRVASLITDSLQQKVYNMALEELEAFLGRSVKPLASLLSSKTLGPMAKHHRLMVEMSAMGHPALIQVPKGCLPIGATVSARGAISSQGLLPQAPLQ